MRRTRILSSQWVLLPGLVRVYLKSPNEFVLSVAEKLRHGASTSRRFSVEQIVGVLKQAQVGVPVAEVIRKAGMSEQTFY
jgi:hypothetical protein